MKITLRAAHEEDFEFVFQLNKVNMKKYVDEIRWRDESFERQEMKGKFTAGTDKIIQADDHDVGVLRVLEDANYIQIDHIELLPAWQHQGIGSFLFQELIETARTKKKIISLKVLKQNPAVHFYKKCGFRITAEEPLKYIMEWVP